MVSSAMAFWNAIKGKVKQSIKEETQNTLKCERFDVTTAPNGTKIGVKQPFGTNEIFIPYSQAVAGAVVGDTVLVIWHNGMSTAKAWYFGDGPA